jgi:tRNA 2-thiocytidine biosynthesis protein TtcA
MTIRDIKQLKKLEKKIYRLSGDFVVKYRMIEEGDRILVALSGGKDSYMLLDTLIHLKAVSPVKFQLLPAHIDIGFNEIQVRLIKEFTLSKGYQLRIVSGNISSVIDNNIDKDKNPCSLCSRIRRGALYTVADENNCNKVALGHHRDDLIETFLLNIFYNGTIATMPVNYSTIKEGIRLIRPLAAIPENYIENYANYKYKEHIYKDKNLCPLVKDKTNLKRERVKKLIASLKDEIPEIEYSLFASLSNIHKDEILDTDSSH